MSRLQNILYVIHHMFFSQKSIVSDLRNLRFTFYMIFITHDLFFNITKFVRNDR